RSRCNSDVSLSVHWIRAPCLSARDPLVRLLRRPAHAEDVPMTATPPVPTPRSPADPPLRIFLSSTSFDLEPDRAAAAQLVEQLEHFAVEMDRFVLRPHLDATALSLEELASSDIYLLLVVWRYGFAPPAAELFVTQEEFREARRLGLPCYVFLADPSTDADQEPSARYPAAVRDREHRTRLEVFRAELQTGQVTLFTTPEDLLAKVDAALHRLLLDRERQRRAHEQHLPFALPQRVRGFVGREAELATLCADLRAGPSVGIST